MRRRWTSTAAAAALGLALALGGITPALAEEAGAADEGSGEVAAQAQTVQTVWGDALPIRIGETVQGVIGDDEGLQYAIVNDDLDPNVDGVVDVTVRATGWGDKEDAHIFATYNLPPIAVVGTLGGIELSRDVNSESTTRAFELESTLLASANEEIEGSEVDGIYLKQKSPAAYIIYVYGSAGCSFELSVTPSDFPAYHKDRYRASDRSTLVRLWGSDAFGTMAAISGSWGSPKTVVLATSEGYWDALAASGLAGMETHTTLRAPEGNMPGCPLLITGRKELTAQTRALLQNLDPQRVVIAGGRAAVSDEVADEVRSLGIEVERVWGKDAVDTAVRIYEAGKGIERLEYVRDDTEAQELWSESVKGYPYKTVTGWGDTAIVATSTGYWDALSVAPYSWRMHAPIFLTGAGNRLTDDALQAVAEGGFSRVVIVGGGAVVSRDVEAQLDGVGIAHERLAGNNAIETSAKIVAWSAKEGFGTEAVYVATTDGYWDALCGAARAGASNCSLALVDAAGTHMEAIESAAAHMEIDEALRSNPMYVTAYVLGGRAAVSDNALQQILNRL